LKSPPKGAATPPRASAWARLPTPIEPFLPASQKTGGCEVLIKRDDLTGSLLMGNKIRKLDFFVSHIKEEMAEVLITCGGAQSNHARAVACLASRMGIRSHLVLLGRERGTPDGNLFLDKMVGASLKFVNPRYYERIDEIMSEEAERFKKRGLKPYIIPEGGSNEIGVWGYVKAATEIMIQLQEMKTKIDAIVVPVGTGGTYAGLLIGSKSFDWRVKIYGYNVRFTAEYFTDRILKLIRAFEEKYQVKTGIKKSEIRIIDGYVGPGYAKTYPREIRFIREIAQSTGIVLDHVYTGKTLLGLVDCLQKGKFPGHKRILFIHTGGLWGVYAARDKFFC
jgi:D-cysteine desulfhydrase